MAKRVAIPSKELQFHLVNKLGACVTPRVQRLGFNTDIPITTVDQIGSSDHVGDTKDIPNVTLTFSAFDVGVKVYSFLTGTDETAYPGAGVDISELGEFDAVAYVKDAIDTDYVKAVHMRRMQVRDFSFSYSLDGDSTEEYTAIGSKKRWFTNNVKVDAFDSGTTSFTLTKSPVVLKNGDYAMSVTLGGVYLTEVASAPSTGEYSISGTTLTTGDTRTGTDKVVAVYQAAFDGSEWTDVSVDDGMPTSIRGKDVPVEIAANSIPRVQSVTINGALNLQQVREMGNREIVGYQKQVPDITGTITVLDTDNELISLLTYGVTTSGTEYSPGEGCSSSGVDLEIKLQDPCDDTEPYTVVKTIYLDEITVVGDSFTSNVNQNVTQTFNFKSSTGNCVVYSGAKS